MSNEKDFEPTMFNNPYGDYNMPTQPVMFDPNMINTNPATFGPGLVNPGTTNDVLNPFLDTGDKSTGDTMIYRMFNPDDVIKGINDTPGTLPFIPNKSEEFTPFTGKHIPVANIEDPDPNVVPKPVTSEFSDEDKQWIMQAVTQSLANGDRVPREIMSVYLSELTGKDPSYFNSNIVNDQSIATTFGDSAPQDYDYLGSICKCIPTNMNMEVEVSNPVYSHSNSFNTFESTYNDQWLIKYAGKTMQDQGTLPSGIMSMYADALNNENNRQFNVLDTEGKIDSVNLENYMDADGRVDYVASFKDKISERFESLKELINEGIGKLKEKFGKEDDNSFDLSDISEKAAETISGLSSGLGAGLATGGLTGVAGSVLDAVKTVVKDEEVAKEDDCGPDIV